MLLWSALVVSAYLTGRHLLPVSADMVGQLRGPRLPCGDLVSSPFARTQWVQTVRAATAPQAREYARSGMPTVACGYG